MYKNLAMKTRKRLLTPNRIKRRKSNKKNKQKLKG